MTIYLGLGSNLGDREGNIRRALAALALEIQVTKTSALRETAPMYVTAQPKFLNAVCEARTEFSLTQVLKKIKDIERTMGKHEHDQPRIIDIDLLLYGDEYITTPELTVPHPRIAERPFVLEPLAEIAPEIAARFQCPKIVGIVNITADSFSDGGKFLGPDKAIAHAKKLIAEGADIVELSGASSNPRAAPVAASRQIERMEPVLAAIDAPVSIDATDAQVQQWALAKGVAYLNDIRGFSDSSLYSQLAAGGSKLVVMHMLAQGNKADRSANTTEEVLASLYSFFETRIPALERAGIAPERLIIDPGMGFFLSSRPEPSFAVLDDLPHFKAHFGLPVMVSVSRKSFLRGRFPAGSRDAAARTLETELYAVEQGADYIRTHDVGQLRGTLVR